MFQNTQDTIHIFMHESQKANETNFNNYWIVGLCILLILFLLSFKSVRNFIRNIKPKEFNIELGGLGISGNLEYYSEDQELAWKIYVELVTRVSANKLEDGTGILREALNSLYTVFGVLRIILRDAGPLFAKPPKKDIDYTIATLLLVIMNEKLRPFLSKWHPLLQEYEHQKPQHLSQFDHEQNWKPQNEKFREELSSLQQGLNQYIITLKGIAQGKNK